MKSLFSTLLVVATSLGFVVACGERPETKTIYDSSKMIQSKKDSATGDSAAAEKTIVAEESVSAAAKPAVNLPGQFSCEARDSVWYNVAKIIKTKISVDLNEEPQIEIKSDAKELNFKIGREYIEGEKIDQELKPECENKITHTDVKYEWTYTCQYFVKDVDGSKKLASSQKSYFRLTNNGVGQLCRVLDQTYSQCWDLSECK